MSDTRFKPEIPIVPPDSLSHTRLKMPITARLFVIALTVLGCLPPAIKWLREKPAFAERTFVVPAACPETNASPFFQTEFVSPEAFTPSVHVGSICELPDGRLGAAWYGGTTEGDPDVKVFFSTRKPGQNESWATPRAVVSRESAEQELRRPISRVGNAVLFADARGQLGLIYVTIPFGGWSVSSLNLKTSRDGGQTWSASRRLTLSPFFNLSELVKNNPALLSDGSWAVPIYHELLGKFSEILWLQTPADGGDISWTKTRVNGGRSAFQPALVAASSNEAIVLARDDGSEKQIHVARSTNAGRSWREQELAGLPNSNSGLDAVRLADGRILLAFNDTLRGRTNLSLAVSNDGGRTWTRRAVIEQEPGGEFSYPYLIQAQNGWIHLVYTWKRKQIKHATFNPAWLDTADGK